MLSTAACKRAPDGSPPGPPSAAATGGEISGTISIDPAMAGHLASTDVVYIIARRAEGPPMPLAAKRIDHASFPLSYTLSSADVMMQGAPFQGLVNIVVRVDQDGDASSRQPGDMEGTYPKNPVPVGSRGVDIVINRMQ